VDAGLTTLTGLTPQQLEEIRQAAALADQASRNVLHPSTVESTAELANSETANRLAAQNGGYVMAEGQLFQLTQTGQAITFRPVGLAPASVPRSSPPRLPPGPTGGAPSGALQAPAPTSGGTGPGSTAIVVPGPVPRGFAQLPNVINVSGHTIILQESGELIPPNPSQPAGSARPGELIVRGYSSGWFVMDPDTGRPIAAALQGGEVWQVEKGGTLSLVVDAEGNVQREGGTAITTRSPLEEVEYGRRVQEAEEAVGGGPSGGTRAVAGAMSIVMVANEILAPIGRTLQVQRANIAQYQGQLRFWIRFGASPTLEMRTQNSDEIQPAGTEPSTAAVYGDPVYPRVTAIDTASLAANLETSIQTYQQFIQWLDLAGNVQAVVMEPGWALDQSAAQRALHRTYHAVLAGEPGTRRGRLVDLTPILEPIERRTLAALEGSMSARVSALPAEERANIFALRSGSETDLYRTMGSGWVHPRENIQSASALLGPAPWVHVLERRGGFAFVEAANADAARSTGVSMYTIQKPIDKVLKEVQASDRAIVERWPEDGTLQGFVAGPSASDPRFGGETRYYRRPDEPDIWTVAIGQLDRFWVRESDLVQVEAAALDRYAPAAAAAAGSGNP
jgi:hypothetical protein